MQNDKQQHELLPRFGLGLSHNGGWSPDAVTLALKRGVKLFDTAKRYGNEKELGALIRQHLLSHNSGCEGETQSLQKDDDQSSAETTTIKRLKREQGIIVSTKLWPGDVSGRNGKTVLEEVRAAAEESIARLGLGPTLDMYLVHWPGKWGGDQYCHPELTPKQYRQQVWLAMESLLSSSSNPNHEEQAVPPLAHRIGVSNFEISHLQDILEVATVIPTLNQIELNPFQRNRKLMSFCRSNGIVIEGYCPFAKGHALKSDKLLSIAAKWQQEGSSTPSEVSSTTAAAAAAVTKLLIRWSILHQGAITIPMSMNLKHLDDNISAGLDALRDMERTQQKEKEEMEKEEKEKDVASSGGEVVAFKALDMLHCDLRVTWDPSQVA